MLPRVASLLALLLLLPAASAGGYDASVDYLEPGASGCGRDAWSYAWQYDSGPSNGTNGSSPAWRGSGDGWGAWASCQDSFTYASVRVSDEDGDLASVGAGARQGSSEGAGQDQAAWWNDEGAWSTSRSAWRQNESGDARTVNASTRAGSLSASDGCARHDAGRSSTYAASDAKGSSEGRSASGEDAQACRAALAARAAGESVTLTPAEHACASSWSNGGGRFAGDGGTGSWDQHASEEACRDGAGAQAGDARLWAGATHACRDEGYGDKQAAQGNATWGSSYHARGCQDGLLVEGPDGIVVFAGTVEEAWSACSIQDGQSWCEGAQDDRRLVLVSWAHSPAGPGPVVVPLP